MKHSFKPTLLPWLTLAAGGVGLLLRFWLYSTGLDHKGLLVEGHPAALFIWLLTAGVLVGLWLGTQDLVAAPKYQFNFPYSISGTAGCGLAATGLLLISVKELLNNGDALALAAAALGIVAALSLARLALLRLNGQQPNILYHGLLCVYFMVRLVSLYRSWSTDPQMQDYFPQLMATVFLMLSCYYRAAFDVNMGRRRPLVICHLAAVYFCCLSISGRENLIFYLSAGTWIFTDLCSLAPLTPKHQEDT